MKNSMRKDKMSQIISQFKGGKRKALETLITNPDSDDWTKDQLAKHCGVSRVTLYTYLSDKKFNDALLECCRMLYAIEMPAVTRKMIRLSKSGDVKASQLAHKAVGLVGDGHTQTVNVAVQDAQPATMQIDTPEQLEQAIASCMAEMHTLKELHANLVAMRRQAGNRLGDGIHPPTETPPDAEG